MKPYRLLLLAVTAGLPAAAHAQDASWNQPYGGNSSMNSAWNNPHRDANGNLQIVNGVIQTGAGSHSTSVQGNLNGGVGNKGGVGVANATAFGNQLNVITSGKFNTVIVNSTQVNNGDVVAVAGNTTTGAEGGDDE